jgi:biopolymer transport protein ExbD
MGRFRYAAPKLAITPLVDVVFLLLVFFLVTTTFIRDWRDPGVKPPEARHVGGGTAADAALVVNVSRGGGITVRGQAAEGEALVALMTASRGEVVIRADARARHADILRVLDACADAGRESARLVVLRRGW